MRARKLSMGYREYPPHANLQDWVKCFWTIEEDSAQGIQDIWPDGCVELFFSTGEIFRVHDDGAASRFPNYAVIGLQTGIMRVRCDSAIRVLSARMYPHLDRCWSPEDLKNLYLNIQPQLDQGYLDESRKILEAWLLQQPRIEDDLAAAFQELYSRHGAISIGELATTRHTSSRQLQRLFATRIGITPKLMAQLIRFARSWSAMMGKPDLTLSDLALELGYADQAHFTNEFRRFAKQSPGQFRKELG